MPIHPACCESFEKSTALSADEIEFNMRGGRANQGFNLYVNFLLSQDQSHFQWNIFQGRKKITAFQNKNRVVSM